MSQDPRQWLAEIKHLQQQLDDLRKERDEAFASAANWRSLYDTEAKQRRAEVSVAQEKIADLQRALNQSQESPQREFPTGTIPTEIVQQVQAIESVTALRDGLMRALAECDRLSHALQDEQAAHAKTRQELTDALGDAISQLSRAQATTSAQPSPENPPAPPSSSASAPTPQTPSLELPPLDQAQSHL